MPSSNDLYNAKTGRWTPAGQVYIKNILKKNPKPSKEQREEIMALTGISSKRLTTKIYDTLKDGMNNKKKKIEVPQKSVQASTANQFLKRLKPAEAVKLYEEMIDRMKCVEYINHRHIQPTLINTDELKKMTGHKDQDGATFAKWMACSIPKKHSNSLNKRTLVALAPNSRWSSAGEHIKAVCTKNKVSCFRVDASHIVLRTKEDEFPTLSSSGITASHLCDTQDVRPTSTSSKNYLPSTKAAHSARVSFSHYGQQQQLHHHIFTKQHLANTA